MSRHCVGSFLCNGKIRLFFNFVLTKYIKYVMLMSEDGMRHRLSACIGSENFFRENHNEKDRFTRACHYHGGVSRIRIRFRRC